MRTFRRKKHYTYVDRLRYGFDRAVSAGTFTHLVLLALLTLAIIMPATAVVIQLKLHQTGAPPYIEREAFWWAIEHAIDPGALQNDQGWPMRLTMLFVTLGGMMVVSLLVGVLTAGIDRRLTELRKGRSLVVESGHTLILGWNATVFTIVRELVLANAHKRHGRVVILAPRDKVEMEDELRTKVGKTGRTRVVCRSGDPIDPDDLAIVNPLDAKAIIVLGPESGDPDAHVIKTLLALTSDARRGAHRYHIVAEIRHPANLEAARLVGRGEAQLVSSSDMISRLIVQTSLISGSSAVYQDLLDFRGSEIYLLPLPPQAGATFGELALRLPDACLIGLMRADGRLLLPAPAGEALRPDDRAIVIARDDDPLRPVATPSPAVGPPRPRQRDRAAPERTLVLGWNRHAPATLAELAVGLGPDAAITVVADLAPAALATAQECLADGRTPVTVRAGDTTSRPFLASLDPGVFDHVIVLGYTDDLDAHEADARTLVTLLHLRSLVEAGGRAVSIVSEMIDDRNRDLAKVARVDDFIVSDRLVSLMLVQMAENPYLQGIYDELLGRGGSQIALRPVTEYVEVGRATTFLEVAAAALVRGEAAFGFRRAALADAPEAGYGVVVNPEKGRSVVFDPQDRVLVIAPPRPRTAEVKLSLRVPKDGSPDRRHSGG